MRRLIFLICAVVLIFDLADDGFLGRVKYVAPHSAAKCVVTSSNHTSGKIDTIVFLPLEKPGKFGHEFTGQPVSGGIVQSLDLDNIYYIGGSGGLPL